jgi:hypothetical protein
MILACDRRARPLYRYNVGRCFPTGEDAYLAGETTALFLALLIGISLGALGSGGSIVTLPILV